MIRAELWLLDHARVIIVTSFLTSKDLDTDDLLRPPNPEPPKRAAMKAVIGEKAEGEGDVYRHEGGGGDDWGDGDGEKRRDRAQGAHHDDEDGALSVPHTHDRRLKSAA